MERPILTRKIDSRTFRSFYFLKEELIDFCRKNGLPVAGGKIELTERIAHYLDTGEILTPSLTEVKKMPKRSALSKNDIIESGFVCTELHRAFFQDNIEGKFSFNVAFQKWLKENAGKTYADAVEAYYRIKEEKKYSRSPIDKQFEYNTYIRDFFADNKGRTLKEAIRCWKYKKSLPGHNFYEASDIIALR